MYKIIKIEAFKKHLKKNTIGIKVGYFMNEISRVFDNINYR